MPDNNEFTFAPGEGDVDQFRRGAIMIAPAEHGFGEVAGDRGIENDDIVLLPLYAVNGPNMNPITQIGLTDQIMEEADLMAVGRNDADTGGRARGILESLRC